MDEDVESFEVIITEVTLDPENEEPPTPEDGNTGNGQSDGNGVSTQTGDAGEPSDPDPEESTIKATFINKPIDDTVQLKGEKIWDDFNNAFDLRPEKKDDLKLTVTRSADPQPEMQNGIDSQPVTDIKITWANDADANTWTYTITGAAGSDGTGTLRTERMPWKYTVTERAEGADNFLQYYDKKPNGGKVTQEGETAEGNDGQPATSPCKNSPTAWPPP